MEATQQPARKKILAEEFIKIWKGEYKTAPAYEQFYQKDEFGKEVVVFNGYEIVGNIIINNSTLPSLELINCMTENFYVSNNCTIGNFEIHNNCTTGNFEIHNNCTTGNFEIHNNCTTGNFYISENCKTGYFDINENCKTGNFQISENCKTGYFQISENCKTGYFSIHENCATGNFEISENCTTGGFYISENCTTENFYISKNCTTENFYISKNCKTGDFEISENCTTGYFYISENCTTGYFEIYQSIVGLLRISKSNTPHISITYNSKIAGIELDYLSATCKELHIADSFVQHIMLSLDQAYRITTDNARIHTVDFTNTLLPKDSYIHFSETSITLLIYNKTYNLGSIIFNNLQPLKLLALFKLDDDGKLIRNKDTGWYEFEDEKEHDTVISLINSDLGKTQFLGCDLNAFKNFEFKNTKMLDVFVADTELPRTNILHPDAAATQAQHAEQKRLALSQFKKIYENRGDTVRATQYLAEEMEVYRAQLRHQTTTGAKEWWNNKAERFNLWLNQFSSHYGNNWLKAAFLTLMINGVLFTLYCWRLGFTPSVPPTDKSWAMFKKLFSYSFEFLNPLRKADFLQHIALPTNSARVVDYISRIIIAYFVYQTIAAFRKFGKKSV